MSQPISFQILKNLGFKTIIYTDTLKQRRSIMEYYNEEISDDEMELLMKMERRRKIKKYSIITTIFVLLTAFIVISLVAYNYNPVSGADEIVVRNDF